MSDAMMPQCNDNDDVTTPQCHNANDNDDVTTPQCHNANDSDDGG